ncbi:MAG: glycosyltransferase family 61 protein [Hyphomicrobiaceae bacterium]|nr:glycosyltransferase family 61 protein [Hyphomicrobiaceae bacterium]
MPAKLEIYPKPISFYQSPQYTGIQHVPVKMGYAMDRVTILGAAAAEAKRMHSQLTCQRYAHIGRLSGEYAIMRWALLAIDRDGTPVRINSAPDEDWHHDSWLHQLEMYCASEEFFKEREELLAQWDSLQLAENAYVLSEVHAARNYYHFTTGFLPKVRRSSNTPDSVLCMPADYVQQPFHVDLLRRTCGHRVLSIYERYVRVRDPHVLQEPFSRDAADWLRAVTGLRAKAGRRRLYVARKGTIVGREHGSVSESDAFSRMLAEYDFETIDFGTGEVPVEEQVRRLDGAGLVLSAHGAQLTNIVYLPAGTAVVELLPQHWKQPAYMQIAALSDLAYFGVVCAVDEQYKMQVDVEMVRAAVTRALAGR